MQPAMQPAIVADQLPQWLALGLLQVALLLFGIVLERTYVNRLTTLTGALALFSHEIVATESAVWVGLYLDVGLVLGVFGLYCYTQAIPVVAPAVRLVSYFLYAPLTVLLVIIIPPWLFPAALVVGAALNYKLVEELDPEKPYFWGGSDRADADGLDIDDVGEYVDRAREFVEDQIDEYGNDQAS
jgi:hypothetical protein